MKTRHLIPAIAALALLTMCAPRPHRSVPAGERQRTLPTDIGMNLAPDAMYYYVEGLKASQLEEDTEKAAELFGRALRLDPEHSPSYFAQANNIANEDAAKALEYSRRAVELDSTNLWYKTQLARLLVFNGQYDKARANYEELIRISPRDPENYRMLAALNEYAGQPYAAVTVLDSAEYRLGRIEELTGYKLQLLVKLSLFDRAINESRAMVEEFPYRYENYVILGDLYAGKKEDSLALANYRMALSLSPDAPDAQIAINQYYRVKGDSKNYLATAKPVFENPKVELSEKVKFFEEVTRNRDFYGANYYQIGDLASTLLMRYPDSYEALDVYGSHLIASGGLEDALKLYKGFLAKPDAPKEAFHMVLEAEAYLNRPDSVDKYTRMALERFPNDVDFYMQRGGAMVYMKDYKGALKTYDHALKYAASDSVRSVIYGAKGDTYHQMEDLRRSWGSYDRALRYDPDNVLVLNNYAYYLSVVERNLDKALGMAQRVMELEPGNATYIDTYAWVLFKTGRYEEAKKSMQQAIALDTHGSSELLVHYGDILYELGDYFMAEFYWKKALEAGHDEDKINQRLEKVKGK